MNFSDTTEMNHNLFITLMTLYFNVLMQYLSISTFVLLNNKLHVISKRGCNVTILFSCHFETVRVLPPSGYCIMIHKRSPFRNWHKKEMDSSYKLVWTLAGLDNQQY